MKIGRFKTKAGEVRPGLLTDGAGVLDLTAAGITRVSDLLESEQPRAEAERLAGRDLPRHDPSQIQWCAPVERQEVWAAGVTYLRSKAARMEESNFSATAYDRVYSAARPELFFKALGEKVVGPGQPVGIRRDARWSVPEPELALVLNSKGRLVGCTVGNDMSARDIEGENLLYLPQAKMYNSSCAIGPWITLDAAEAAARAWRIRLEIRRNNAAVFSGETTVGQLKRRFDELAEFLFRSQQFPHGAVLLTGTGIVPPDAFTLQAADIVKIEISGIGSLENPVMIV